MNRLIPIVVLTLMTFSSLAQAQQGRPTKQQVEVFLAQAITPLRSCLARSLPAPPRPAVVVTLEFDPGGGFPMPMEIEAAPGSAIERCVGEALAELSAPVIPGPPLRVECRFPLANSNAVACRPAAEEEPPPPPPPPPPPASPSATPTSGGGSGGAEASTPEPPQQPQAPLSREEVAAAMGMLRPQVIQCTGAANPPPTIRLRIEISGDGTVSLLETQPVPPATVSNCLARAVSELRLRATGRESLRVLYPFNLQ